MNVLFVSHCDFTGNSALHVLAIANELQRQFDVSPIIAVPNDPATVGDVGRPSFAVLGHDDVRAAGGATFPDGRGADLVHAFTPREHVRLVCDAVVRSTGIPYVVHLEDNEHVVLRDDVGSDVFEQLVDLPLAVSDAIVPPIRTHPRRGAEFLRGAAGITVLLDTLLEFVPDGVPTAIFWPGFDESIAREPVDLEALRGELGVDARSFVLVYTGNIHASNVGELRSLYTAVGALRAAGRPVVLLKTGWDYADMSWVQELALDGGLRELGFVSRRRVGELIQLADALVQPGGSNSFNDYRFPSKLPDFLVSGRPVVLPATNIGRKLRDETDALLLRRGDAMEIFDAVARLMDDPELRDRIGSNGRAFALEALRWSENVRPIAELYAEVGHGGDRQPTRVASCRATAPRDVARVLAFYLPQFHAIPENDAWWGEGFTEWTNVRRGRPQFRGHHQPHVPTGLGYYDLNDPEVMVKQAELARRHGIYGFCFYYYWFSGRRILERPLTTMLDSGRPSFPFCYCWANENWTRRWDGLDDDVLLAQDYAPGWEQRFIHDVLPALSDPRYIRIDGRPLLLVYRANLIPEVKNAVEVWRSVAQTELGADLHLAAVQSFGITDPRPYGFDAAVEFPPHTARFLIDHDRLPGVDSTFEGYFEDYEAVMRHQLALPLPDYAWYRGVMPSWDNTARRGSLAHILVGSSPSLYQTWLRKVALQSLARSSVDEPLIFVNSWNEWAEGAHLEPDEKNGDGWLRATEAALRDALRQLYASRGWSLSEDDAAAHVRESISQC